MSTHHKTYHTRASIQRPPGRRNAQARTVQQPVSSGPAGWVFRGLPGDVGQRAQALRQLQRQYGNQYVQRLITQAHRPGGVVGGPKVEMRREPVAQSLIQRKPEPPIDIKTVAWEQGVEVAHNLAKSPRTGPQAEAYYKALIVRAAQQVTAPAPLVDRKPATRDIRWSWSTRKGWAAAMDGTRVDNYPDDYWQWLSFNPGAVHADAAFTISILAHELDHAAHARLLYNQWQRSGKQEKWDTVWVKHVGKWTEPAIQVKMSGLAPVLAGLPKEIEPSAIEFRAYTAQFIQSFHRVSLDKQDFLANAIILFYPVKKQQVAEKISDLSLHVAATRRQLLSYFKAPPVKEEQQEIIRIRMAAELKQALVLFRPSQDQEPIKKDFKEIFDYEFDADQRNEARTKYKPQP